jgi:phospholipase/carboxylesterase
MATDDQLLESITDLVPKLLTTLEAFEQVQRNLHPGRYDQLAEFISPFADQLSTARLIFDDLVFPADLAGLGEQISKSTEYALRACDGVQRHGQGPGNVMKAMRAQCRAQEYIYPLSAVWTPVSQYFLERPARENKTLQQQLIAGAANDKTGLFNAGNDRQSRGGFTLYIPEHLDPEKPASMVVALHGGSGHGADFLWSWVREARTRGFVLLAPTSQMETWSLMGEEHDLPALMSMLEFVKSTWPLDEQHILLTGMSDGGTYSLLAGLNKDSPFTHLAPFSSVLHPEIAMTGRLEWAFEKPIYLVHGTLDWMFPVEAAYMARDELERAGAHLTFKEIEGLSHTYARNENPDLIEWFNPDLIVPV